MLPSQRRSATSRTTAQASANHWLRFRLRTLAFITTAITSLCNCDQDPLSSAYSSHPPPVADLAGTYVADSGVLTTLLAAAKITGPPPTITLRSDLSLTITGIKALEFREIDGQIVKSSTFNSTWDTGRNDEHWVIMAGTVQILIVRDKPPHGLEVMVGKPGQERALRFERQAVPK